MGKVNEAGIKAMLPCFSPRIPVENRAMLPRNAGLSGVRKPGRRHRIDLRANAGLTVGFDVVQLQHERAGCAMEVILSRAVE